MGTITLPNNPGTIQNAQVTDATKVMENFTAIVSEVNGNIDAVNLGALAVETAKIAALAVTAAKLATDAVETLKIKDANVTAAKIATDAVETLKIKDANVTTAKIANLNVTAGKLAADAVETAKIKDINVTTAKIANENVTLAKIARGTLDTYLKAQGAGAASIYEALALRDTGIHIGDNSRAGAAGSGVQVITGVGFEPSVIIITAAIDVGTEIAWSIGFGKVGQNMCIYRQHDNAVTHHNTMCIYWFEAAAADAWTGYITAVGADGFTITWTKTGAPSNIGIVYLCLP